MVQQSLVAQNITDNDEPDRVNARRMNRNLTLVDALITWPGVLDLKSPVVWVLEMQREPWVGAVSLHANRQ